MKYDPNGLIQLELDDLIRMNRLVRGRVDFPGFLTWYKSLRVNEQTALLCQLHMCAQQAGYDEQTYQEALQAARLSDSDLLVRQTLSFLGGYSSDLGDEQEWLAERKADERQLILRLLVYLFGLAEEKVYARETKVTCNHWWHRDLQDERVVSDLLSNPDYFRTARKDDDRVKAG